MLWGIPTLIENNSIEESVKLCKDLGLNFIELNMNLPQYQLENMDVENLNYLRKKNNIFYTIHLDENLNVSDFNSRIADAYLATVLDTIKIAEKLDIKILNMHLSKGVYFTLPDKKIYLFEQYNDKYLKSITKFKDTVENAIGNSDIKICIENTNGYTDFQIQAIDILLQSPVFGLTFDTGHNYCIGGTDEIVITNRIDKLYYVHLHDAQGKSDHMALGTGNIDVKKHIEMTRRNNCTVVLEPKTIEALNKSASFLQEQFINILIS